jgi:hypothetical protein
MVAWYDRKSITIGSDWRIADVKREEAEGIASSALTIVAPELWPAIVIFDGDPPIIGTPTFKSFKALMTSPTAKFVSPSGAMKPSCTRVNEGTDVITNETALHQA